VNKKTLDLLLRCKKYGITRVAIGIGDESIPLSCHYYCDAIFTYSPEGKGRDEHGWPAIWGIVSDMGISIGAGSTNYHQAVIDDLVKGVYYLRKGKWRLKALNSKIIAVASEGYSSRRKCVHGLFAVQRYIWLTPVPVNHV